MTARLQIPDAFKRSYDDFGTYPCNLIHHTSYPVTLEAYQKRLFESASKLFTGQADAHVAFRDFTSAGLEKQNVYNDAELKQWLGDHILADSRPSSTILTKQDPKCRFIFIHSDNSREPLKLSISMLTRILSYHQVTAKYLDFISVFGRRDNARDLRFSGFKEESTISNAQQTELPVLCRSGRQFQLCYNLKSVACSSASDVPLLDKEWSIRQAAFHHKFDIKEGTTLWIIIQARLEIKKRIEKFTGSGGRPEDQSFNTLEQCFRSTLRVHLLQCQWSTEEWRWYINWLEDIIDTKTNDAIHSRRDPGEDRPEYTPGDLQSLQYYEDKINEVIMVLEANTNVLNCLRKFYARLTVNKNFPLRKSCNEDIISFLTQIDDMIYDSRMQIARAKLLVRITSDRKVLILQHLQSQATEKMETLTLNMHRIGTMAQKEAIAMRIITVVTLIYLPATFVSTFFSTDVIKYQNRESFSYLAMIRWVEVTLPLTALTLAIGWMAYRHASIKMNRKLKTQILPTYQDEKDGI